LHFSGREFLFQTSVTSLHRLRYWRCADAGHR
jgi:hypothetical protein